MKADNRKPPGREGGVLEQPGTGMQALRLTGEAM
jgi:hypothetical protein